MKQSTAIKQVRRLALLRYFPNSIEAMEALVELVCEWCTGNEKDSPEQQCAALVSTALRSGCEWEGVAALRAVFLDLYPPPRKVSAYGGDPDAVWIPEWKKTKEDLPNGPGF